MNKIFEKNIEYIKALGFKKEEALSTRGIGHYYIKNDIRIIFSTFFDTKTVQIHFISDHITEASVAIFLNASVSLFKVLPYLRMVHSSSHFNIKNGLFPIEITEE